MCATSSELVTNTAYDTSQSLVHHGWVDATALWTITAEINGALRATKAMTQVFALSRSSPSCSVHSRCCTSRCGLCCLADRVRLLCGAVSARGWPAMASLPTLCVGNFWARIKEARCKKWSTESFEPYIASAQCPTGSRLISSLQNCSERLACFLRRGLRAIVDTSEEGCQSKYSRLRLREECSTSAAFLFGLVSEHRQKVMVSQCFLPSHSKLKNMSISMRSNAPKMWFIIAKPIFAQARRCYVLVGGTDFSSFSRNACFILQCKY